MQRHCLSIRPPHERRRKPPEAVLTINQTTPPRQEPCTEESYVANPRDHGRPCTCEICIQAFRRATTQAVKGHFSPPPCPDICLPAEPSILLIQTNPANCWAKHTETIHFELPQPPIPQSLNSIALRVHRPSQIPSLLAPMHQALSLLNPFSWHDLHGSKDLQIVTKLRTELGQTL